MYDVHDHGETHPVRLIDQLFQLVRRTETGRGGEEATYVIAERSIIGMFLYSHDLNGVITILRYTRQYILTEFIIRPHLLLVGAHTDMALVDQKGRLLRFEPFILEFIRFLRVPYLSAEYLRLLILHHPASPCGNTFSATAVPLDQQLKQVLMIHLRIGQSDLPYAIRLTFKLVFIIFLPSVECSNQINSGSIRCPFTEHPPFRGFV